jgi:hypothetical protein
VSARATTAYPECVPATWLGERMALEPLRIEAMRRAGELIAVWDAGSNQWLYPAWQFERWAPRRGINRVVVAAREARIPDERLYELLTAPLGLTRTRGGRRLADVLVEGRVDDVVAAIRSAA